MKPQPPVSAPARPSIGPRRYWRNNLRLTAVLLGVWFVVTFVVSFYARELSFRFFGWPFSFWVAAQGALFVYGLIVAVYAAYMNRQDDRLVLDDEGTPGGRQP